MDAITNSPSPAAVGEGGAQPLRAGRVRDFQCLQNGVNHPIGIGKNLVVPKPDHTPSLAFQPKGSTAVALAVGMLPAVHFDDQTMGDTGEIKNDRAQWVLTPEFVALKTSPSQSRPQPTLGISQSSPQLACLAIGHDNEDSREPLTLPKLCFGPLPLPPCGRGAMGGLSCA